MLQAVALALTLLGTKVDSNHYLWLLTPPLELPRTGLFFSVCGIQYIFFDSRSATYARYSAFTTNRLPRHVTWVLATVDESNVRLLAPWGGVGGSNSCYWGHSPAPKPLGQPRHKLDASRFTLKPSAQKSHHFAPHRVGMCRRHLAAALFRTPKVRGATPTNRYRRGGCGGSPSCAPEIPFVAVLLRRGPNPKTCTSAFTLKNLVKSQTTSFGRTRQVSPILERPGGIKPPFWPYKGHVVSLDHGRKSQLKTLYHNCLLRVN